MHPRILIKVSLPANRFDTTECMNGEQRPGCYFAHAQDDLNLHILRMFEGTFSLDEGPFYA